MSKISEVKLRRDPRRDNITAAQTITALLTSLAIIIGYFALAQWLFTNHLLWTIGFIVISLGVWALIMLFCLAVAAAAKLFT